MYRGLTTFNCTNCGHQFKSHDIEYRATSYSVPQRCPNCGSVRTMPGFWIEVGGKESSTQLYASIWEEIEQAEKKREERIEAKRKAEEEQQRKKRAKKRKHMSRKQREAYDKKRAKKAAKRSKIATDRELPYREEIILVGPTWFPPDTPLRIDSDESSATAHTLTQS